MSITPLDMTLVAETLESSRLTAVSMDIHFLDGTVRGSDDLEWYVDYTGLVVKIMFYGPESVHLWDWFPEPPMAVVAHGTVLTMPAKMTLARA